MKRSLLDEIECYDDGSAYCFPSLAQGSSEDRMIFGRAFFHQKKCLFLSKETRKDRKSVV